jgi:diguanylate cyclase (GGDEF)-like protein
VTWYHSPLAEGGGREANILSVGLDVTERKDAEHRLSWLDEHDPLTGLVNRHGFRKHLEELFAHDQNGEWEGALLVCDLDQFKLVNDAGGHHIGDAVLKTVAETLNDGIVGEHHLARLDSDQFAMLLNVGDADAAAAVARRVNELLADVDWPSGAESRRLRACCGIAMVSKQVRTAADLLGQAELALELAKEAGGGRWHLFKESDRNLEHVRRNLFWQTQVESALENDRFVIYCQPIQEILTGRISHYEVLLRLREDDGSVSSPAPFINAAERCGMVHLVDRRVTSLALERLAELRKTQGNLFFAINLSARALGDEDFLPHLQTELKRTGVEPARVIFEITETAAVADFSAARRLMGAIRNLGCRFALDDFGVGFSSFYYLKQLPIDFVKIDGSFINQLAESPDDQVLVRALREVAAGFGKKTIAEYVEDKQTLDLLEQFGIDYAQGYYIGRPELVETLFSDANSVNLG